VINIYGSSMEKSMQTMWCTLKFLSEGLEYYKDTRIKLYNITEVTAELNSYKCALLFSRSIWFSIDKRVWELLPKYGMHEIATWTVNIIDR